MHGRCTSSWRAHRRARIVAPPEQAQQRQLTPRQQQTMAALMHEPVDERAFAFADQLRASLRDTDMLGNIGQVQTWTTDAYIEHVLAELDGAARPVVFTAPLPRALGAGCVHEVLRRGPIAALEHAAKARPHDTFSAHWPQLQLPDAPLRALDYLPFFVVSPPLRAPPNVIDDRVAKLGCSVREDTEAYSTPAAYQLLSMLERPHACQHGEVPDASDLVLSPPNALTRFHIDSGFVGLCDLVVGEKLWAVCSLHDGLALGLVGAASPASIATFLAAPSAALVRLRAGQMLLVPAGFFHFVVTTEAALGFSSNALTLGGLATSRTCATTPGGRAACQMHDDDFARLNLTHREGLKRHVAAAAKGTLARRLEAAGASRAVCERYVKRVQT